MTRTLEAFRRIVVKIGSSLLVDEQRRLKTEWLESLAADIASLAGGGATSSSSRPGRSRSAAASSACRTAPLQLEESQAAAAVGQIALARA